MIKFYQSVTLVLSVICSPIFNCNTDAQKEDPICAKEEDTKTNNYNPICQYYLAPSSIPNAGFGVYTTQSIPANTPLQHQSDSPTIVVTDIKLHNGAEIKWLHANYFWAGDEYSADHTSESVLGFGALANFHPYLHSIDPKMELYRDDVIPRDSDSPGIGASSLHVGWQFQTTREILAGEEVFAYYGEKWIDFRQDSSGSSIPSSSDYRQAASVITNIRSSGLDGPMTPSIITRVHYNIDHITDQHLSTIKDTASLFNDRASSLLPITKEKFVDAISLKNGNHEDINIVKLDVIASNVAYQNLIPRTLDWIRHEGNCLDNLIPGLSTLPDAGRGGFAQRFIPKYSMVVPSPLIQIIDRDTLLMYDLKIDEKTRKMKKDNSQGSNQQSTGQQMLINYCFSHPNINITLCPQSNAVLLNHCSIRKSYGGDCEKYNKNEGGKRGPNAKIRWAGDDGRESWDPNTQNWLKMTMTQIKDLTSSTKRGLSFDIIATRDISPGEEVFIDYGLEWEEAWQSHVEHWIPPTTESYIPISQLNSLITVLRTPKELENKPYPDNAEMRCKHSQEYHDTTQTVREYDKKFFFKFFYPCRVIDRQLSADKNVVYTVEIFAQQEQSITLTNGKRTSLILVRKNYPRDEIIFIPKKYSSDEHLKGAFRHYITIKDEMIPLQWKETHIHP